VTRFDIVIYEGVDELDFVAPLEILRAATDTGADATSGLDIGLHLVRRYFGEDAAAEASRRSEYP